MALSVSRDTILEELIPYFAKDDKYVLLICDMGFGKVDKLKEQFPDRVINCGVMEQATVGIASGMTIAGSKPIIYSIAVFIVFRALEQIRNDIVLSNRNVKIIGNGSGDYFKDLGSCHWCKNDDISLMETINMPVYSGYQFKEWIESDIYGYIRV